MTLVYDSPSTAGCFFTQECHMHTLEIVTSNKALALKTLKTSWHIHTHKTIQRERSLGACEGDTSGVGPQGSSKGHLTLVSLLAKDI